MEQKALSSWLIGRDPRSVSVNEFHQAGIEGAAILAVIRAKCLDCCVQHPEEVRKCVSVTCPNWPYRMGANPFRKQEVSEEDREARRARGRALAARRYAAVSADVKNTSVNSTDNQAGIPVPPDSEDEPPPPLLSRSADMGAGASFSSPASAATSSPPPIGPYRIR